MPSYSYLCEKCHNSFEMFFYIKDYNDQPKCSYCNSKKTHRLYAQDILTLNSSVKKSDSELKTIGDLADRNRDKLSNDEKQSLYDKHNNYKEKQSEKPLPQGMTRMKKGIKTIWPK